MNHRSMISYNLRQHIRDLRATAWALALASAIAWTVGCNSNASSRSSDPATPVVKPPAVADIPPGDPREAIIATVVGRLLETNHVRSRPLDDSVSKVAFARYLKNLDPGKRYLLATDVEKLRGFSMLMDDEMHEGNLSLAHMGGALMAKRRKVVAALIADQLSRPFDFTNDESVETDPEKVAFCATEAELAERWRKGLELEALGRVVRMVDLEKALAKVDKKSHKKVVKKPGKTPANTKSVQPSESPSDTAGSASGSSASSSEEVEAPAREPIPKTAGGKEQKARSDMAKSYAARMARLAEPEPLDGASMFLNAVTSVYDPHTSYFPPARKENFDIRMSGSLEGIGAVLQESDHYIKIVSIVPGGATWRQGDIDAGDMILSVAQEGKEPVDVGDMRINKVVHMIRGPKGTVVTLTIQKTDKSVKVISITRDVVKIETAYARGALLESGGGGQVGYIYLPSFYGNTRTQPGLTPERSCTDDLRKLLVKFSRRGISSVVIDLRGNGGGLLDDARDISGLFIERGPIVQTRYADGEKDILRDVDASVSFAGDVVVLVDRFSASASEILAAALQDYGRALIVGTSATHGKGTVQMLVSLDRIAGNRDPEASLGVLKLTRQQFFRINGGSTQWRGVVPDIMLPDPSAYIDSGERSLDNSIPWSKVEPLPFTPWPKAAWSLEKLIAASASRSAKEPAFAQVEKRVELLRKRTKDTIFPLKYDVFVAESERDIKEIEAVSPDMSKGPARFKVTTVPYSGAAKVAKRPGRKGRKAKPDDDTRWRKNLSHDPWLAETLAIVADMRAALSTAP